MTALQLAFHDFFFQELFVVRVSDVVVPSFSILLSKVMHTDRPGPHQTLTQVRETV